MGMPEGVVNVSLRSAGVADLVLVSDMEAGKSKMEIRKELLARQARQTQYNHFHNLRALRNEVTAKKRKSRATATARPMSQRATSRVQARKAALNQPSARTAKTAAMAS